MKTMLQHIIWECSHQFSWPRRDENGTYYQLCVNCGSKYRYDWSRMRRLARVNDELPETTRTSHRPQKVSWTPRERRLKHVVPLTYRVTGCEEWREGTSENLSRSGLLFRSNESVEVGAEIEIKVEMPDALTGNGAKEVVCKATVARVSHIEAARKEPEYFMIACSVAGYEYKEQAA